MDFFRVRHFRKARKLKSEEESGEENNQEQIAAGTKDQVTNDPAAKVNGEEDEEEDDDDDDFITNEVKRRLKELRKNSFMVLIPEETCPEEEEEEEESSSSEWRESEVEDGGYPWCGLDTLYSMYCERMVFFDKMSAQQLKEGELCNNSNESPRTTTKKLALTLRNLSFKKRGELHEDCEQLQQSQEEDPYHNLETAYVAQVCLAWEALHCQYIELCKRIASLPESPATYCRAAQAFQQFEVLLQSFIENKPFGEGSRVEIYARTRISLLLLLQVPTFQGKNG